MWEVKVLVAHLCPTLWDPRDCSPPGSSVHGISQARILKQVATSYSRGSSWPKDGTHISCVSCIGREILQHCTMWEAQLGLNQDQTKIRIFLWLLSLNSVLLSITPTSLLVTSHLHASDLLRKPSRQSWRMAPILDMLVCFLIKSLNGFLCLLITCMLQVSSEDLDVFRFIFEGRTIHYTVFRLPHIRRHRVGKEDVSSPPFLSYFGWSDN